jgi:hypothetical protein
VEVKVAVTENAADMKEDLRAADIWGFREGLGAAILAPKTTVFSSPLPLSDPLCKFDSFSEGDFGSPSLADYHRTSRRG